MRFKSATGAESVQASACVFVVVRDVTVKYVYYRCSYNLMTWVGTRIVVEPSREVSLLAKRRKGLKI